MFFRSNPDLFIFSKVGSESTFYCQSDPVFFSRVETKSGWRGPATMTYCCWASIQKDANISGSFRIIDANTHSDIVERYRQSEKDKQSISLSFDGIFFIAKTRRFQGCQGGLETQNPWTPLENWLNFTMQKKIHQITFSFPFISIKRVDGITPHQKSTISTPHQN